MSRVYKTMSYPTTCRVCGVTVTLSGMGVRSRNARSQARARGYVFCQPPKPCSAAGRAASIKAACATPAARERLARQNRGRKRKPSPPLEVSWTCDWCTAPVVLRGSARKRALERGRGFCGPACGAESQRRGLVAQRGAAA